MFKARHMEKRKQQADQHFFLFATAYVIAYVLFQLTDSCLSFTTCLYARMKCQK